jgi:hypothetical protein
MNNIKPGDMVKCVEDISYFFKGEQKIVKKGYKFVVRGIIGDDIIIERFGKPFIISRDKLELEKG